ncbi:MAG: peptidoglycan editing factor PgeF [Lachnospiraceae bacterium]|nr:peptidoglycan editing factor PgeF [Lachnospiraceae bacterium]
MQIKWYSEQHSKLNVNKKGDVVYLSSPVLDDIPWLRNGISTRLGGVSKDFCGSMNFAYNDYDHPGDVYKNYQIFCNATGIDINKIVTTKQVHSNTVVKLDETHTFRSISEKGCDFPSVDGVITNVSSATLFAFSADCSLIQIVDPVNKAIGLCHSGWRGTVGRISQNAINMMHENYGTNPSDLLVTIGPSICPECFEVEWDMISEAREGFSESDYDKIYYQKNDTKYQFNLWEANKIVLEESGVKCENIFMPNLCTKCNPDFLFSHRNSGLKRGTLIAFLGIK